VSIKIWLGFQKKLTFPYQLLAVSSKVKIVMAKKKVQVQGAQILKNESYL